MIMKCSVCNKPLKETSELYHYTECGLDNVYLGGVDIYKCENCGNIEAKIPKIDELHMVIAKCIISKPQRLNNKEIRYLRKYLGLKAVDLAKILNVSKSTLSRWEAGKEKIGTANDILLRLLVIRYKEEELHSLFPGKFIEKFEQIRPKISEKAIENRIKFDKNFQAYESCVA